MEPQKTVHMLFHQVFLAVLVECWRNILRRTSDIEQFIALQSLLRIANALVHLNQQSTDSPETNRQYSLSGKSSLFFYWVPAEKFLKNYRKFHVFCTLVFSEVCKRFVWFESVVNCFTGHREGTWWIIRDSVVFWLGIVWKFYENKRKTQVFCQFNPY